MAETLRDLFLTVRHLYGDQVAVRFEDDRQTFRELIDRSCRLSNVLSGLGLVPGDRVGVMVDSGIEQLEPYCAAGIGGFVAVAVNHRLAPAEVRYILEHSGARAFIHTSGVTETVDGVGVGQDLTVLTIGPARSEGALSYADALASASSDPPNVEVPPAARSLIAYTSGTTGFPKGATLTHERQIGAMRAATQVHRFSGFGRSAFAGSLSFAASLSAMAYPTIRHGGSIRFFQKLDPEQWFDAMSSDHTTLTNIPTPLIPSFLELARRSPGVLKHLETISHSGSPAPRDQLAELIDVCGDRFSEVWGMTETGGSALTATTPSDRRGLCDAHDPITTVGRHSPVSKVFVQDASGAEIPAGDDQVGELVVECPTLFTEYWNAPEATAAVREGDTYRTGDLGWIDKAGYVYLTGGRLSEMIVTGGMNVYPVEVEQALLSHPDVTAAAVFGGPDQKWGEAVIAVVQLHTGAEINESQLQSYVRLRIAGYKKPQKIHFVPEMPLTVSMKIKKHELRQRFIG